HDSTLCSHPPPPTTTSTLSLHDALPIWVAASPFGTGLAAGSQSDPAEAVAGSRAHNQWLAEFVAEEPNRRIGVAVVPAIIPDMEDRKSTRLNSSHVSISYAVFCLKKKRS